MRIRMPVLVSAILTLAGCAQSPDGGMTAAPEDGNRAAGVVGPLAVGETLTIDSRIMGEVRHINVLVPTIYGEKIDAPMPVLYMLDGGINEDFLHIAGLVQILVCNGGMRPYMLVGIENTVRRRDLSGPTTSEEDRKMAPVVGGSARFRRFIKDELMPEVRARYRTTDEAAIVGESLAGLFALETFFLEPDMFSTYIAVDPSIWWNNNEMVNAAAARLQAMAGSVNEKTVFFAASNEPSMAQLDAAFAKAFEANYGPGIIFHHAPFPAEGHATIYHPAALLAFRTVFAPPATPKAAK